MSSTTDRSTATNSSSNRWTRILGKPSFRPSGPCWATSNERLQPRYMCAHWSSVSVFRAPAWHLLIICPARGGRGGGGRGGSGSVWSDTRAPDDAAPRAHALRPPLLLYIRVICAMCGVSQPLTRVHPLRFHNIWVCFTFSAAQDAIWQITDGREEVVCVCVCTITQSGSWGSVRKHMTLVTL